MTSGLANPLPAANSRRSYRYRGLEEICSSWASARLGSPTAVAEGERSAAATQDQTTARLLTISMYCCRAWESLSRFQAMR